jgi:hypothetical protein
MSMSPARSSRVPLLFCLVLNACSQHEPGATAPAPAAAPAPPNAPALDAQLIGERLGATPRALPGGALAVTLPRSGVPVKVEGAALAEALNTELLFWAVADGAALSGSVDVLEDEVNPVLDTLLAHGIRVVGLYNRQLYDAPRVLVLRFEGRGNPALLASGSQSISSVLRDTRLRSSKPLSELPGDAPEPGTLDAAALSGLLGVTATTADGVVTFEVPRPAPEAGANAPGTPAPGTLLPAAPLLHASLSGSDARAAISGTLVLSAPQIVPTLAALRTANVQLVGLVPQDTQGDTGWYALYFRGKNNSLALMRGLAQALIARGAAH